MRRALAWLLASYAVHATGVAAFVWTWDATFGSAARQIPPEWDIPLVYAELLLTGLCAGAFAIRSAWVGARPILLVPQVVSAFFAAMWLWAILLFESIV